MKKRVGSTLHLSRETLRALDASELQEIQGAATAFPCSFPCTKPTLCKPPAAGALAGGIRPFCVG
ncbi:MAG TPA: hypothetical protein VKY89_15430 [Thermoanaerobaculia bacterium]|jgi:hypothetical protein|nr:hypothetical protein [Thermoanaerobaculia bacterium]